MVGPLRWFSGKVVIGIGVGAVALAVVVVLAINPFASSADAAKGTRGPEVLPSGHKVVICHAANNTFTRNEVDIDSIVKGTGHGGHPHDIIPPFRYQLAPTSGVQHYPGRNWDEEGEAIWTNGCARPAPSGGTIEVFACVDPHAAGFDATFGYINSAGTVEILPGTQGESTNAFSPEPVDRGQVTRFREGYVPAAFTVENITESELTWTVRYRGHADSVTVSRSSAPCSIPPSPQPAVPIGVFVTCVVNHGSRYDAVFGYESGNADPKTIPIGAANSFAPAPGDRGQPSTFVPGRHRAAVTVRDVPSSVALRWTLALTDTRTATATADFGVKCLEPPGPPPSPQPPPPQPPPPSARPLGIFASCVTVRGSSYDAVFGYVNENEHTVTVPIGDSNAISPGPAGQGQPEAFVPGFVDAAFAVRGVAVGEPVTWRVGFGDEVRVATATARLPACLTDSIRPVSSAAISKTATPRTAVVGGRLAATIVLRNAGSSVLAPVGVADVMRGAPVRVVLTRPSRGRCQTAATAEGGSPTVRCNASTLAPGASLRVEIGAIALGAGVARDRALILGLRRDRVSGEDAATAAVRISPQPPFSGLGRPARLTRR